MNSNPPNPPAIVWSPQGKNLVAALREAYEKKLEKEALAHCLTTASTVVTEENVEQARKRLESPEVHAPLAVIPSVGGTLMFGVGTTLLGAAWSSPSPAAPPPSPSAGAAIAQQDHPAGSVASANSSPTYQTALAWVLIILGILFLAFGQFAVVRPKWFSRQA